MSIYLKHRPETMDEMLGNRSVVAKLKAFTADKDRPHAYLFSGSVGCGKTTAAEAYARDLGITDIREINASESRGIDVIRDVIEEMRYAPFNYEILWIFDEAHGLTTEAANAFLKLLENPPSFSYFILCTTEPQKINRAIESRCQHMMFEPLSPKKTMQLVNSVCKKEKIDLDEDILLTLVEVSAGIPRKALVLLENIIGLDIVHQEKILLSSRYMSSIEDSTVIKLLRTLTNKSEWYQVASTLSDLEAKKEDPERLRRAVLAYMSKIILNEKDTKKIGDIADRMKPFISGYTFNSGFAGFVLQCFQSHRSGGTYF